MTEAWRSLGANLSTTVAATMTVLISMFLLGLFIAFGTWTVSWSTHVKSELLVKVYFQPDATRQEKTTLAAQLQQNQYVLQNQSGIKYVSKEAALAGMKRRFPELVAGLASNPLPDSLAGEADARRGHRQALHLDRQAEAATRRRQGATTAKQNSHAHPARRALHRRVLHRSPRACSLIASVLLIANTIRLSIFSRRREIEVMKLVGATNWFVRGPFMLEGAASAGSRERCSRSSSW